MLTSFLKDILPAYKRNNITYKYLCHCDIVYVGKASQGLEKRIQQLIAKFIRNKIKPQKDCPRRQCKFAQNTPISVLSISQHFSDNK